LVSLLAFLAFDFRTLMAAASRVFLRWKD
jgi:hypothetical protein